MNVVAITGTTGKSGQWFLKTLAENAGRLEAYSFRIAVRPSSDTSLIDSLPLPVTKAEGDLSDPEFCRRLCAGADTLLHIAGIRLSFPLVRVAAEAGVKRMILVHTTGIYSKYKAAAGPYIRLESEVLDLQRKYGLELTILRPTMIYGDLQDKNVVTFIKMVDRFRIFPVIKGAKYQLQPVCAKDLGEAYFSVLMAPEATRNKSYNLSGGRPIALIDMFRTIGEQLGKRNTFLSVPFWLAYSGAWAVYCLTFARMDYREKVQRMIEPRVFGHEEAARDFGYAPVNFEDGVQDEIRQYLAQNR